MYGMGVGIGVWDVCRDGCRGWVYGLVYGLGVGISVWDGCRDWCMGCV